MADLRPPYPSQPNPVRAVGEGEPPDELARENARPTAPSATFSVPDVARRQPATTMAAVYGWERCTHEGIGLPGCPTCDPSKDRCIARARYDEAREWCRALGVEIGEYVDVLHVLSGFGRKALAERGKLPDSVEIARLNRQLADEAQKFAGLRAEADELHQQLAEARDQIDLLRDENRELRKMLPPGSGLPVPRRFHAELEKLFPPGQAGAKAIVGAPGDTLDGYQQQVLRTATRKPGEYLPREKDLTTWALGVAGEAGEVADLVKKHLGHGHELDREKLVKELGDVLWYVAALAHYVGAPLSEVAAVNVAKLWKRYPNGFEQERSKNRGPDHG